MTLTLRPMADREPTAWLRRSAAQYIRSRVEAGETLEQATANSESSFRRYFPGGRPAEDQHLFDVFGDDETMVGYLWIGVIDAPSNAWWVFDIEIAEPFRGRGFGRETMILAEQRAADRGAATLGLNVFGYNTVARGLYESLGYETTAVQMKKPVGSASP